MIKILVSLATLITLILSFPSSATCLAAYEDVDTQMNLLARQRTRDGSVGVVITGIPVVLAASGVGLPAALVLGATATYMGRSTYNHVQQINRQIHELKSIRNVLKLYQLAKRTLNGEVSEAIEPLFLIFQDASPLSSVERQQVAHAIVDGMEMGEFCSRTFLTSTSEIVEGLKRQLFAGRAPDRLL